MAYKAILWNAAQCDSELAFIRSIDPHNPGTAFNHDPLCFARYCNMQANHAYASGFPLTAHDVLQCRDIANPNFRSEARDLGLHVECGLYVTDTQKQWQDLANAKLQRRISRPFWERPCAAAGLDSYRYRGAYGYIMIGATSDADALNEASRSLSYGTPTLSNLEKWDGNKYLPIVTA